MDIRDFNFWIREAGVRALMKRTEAYSASLLPYQDGEVIKARLNDIRWRIFDLENEDEINDIEKAAGERLEEIRKKKGKNGR